MGVKLWAQDLAVEGFGAAGSVTMGRLGQD